MSPHRRVICALALFPSTNFFFRRRRVFLPFSSRAEKIEKLKIPCYLLSREILLDICAINYRRFRSVQHYAVSDFTIFLLGLSNRFVNLPLLLAHMCDLLLFCANPQCSRSQDHRLAGRSQALAGHFGDLSRHNRSVGAQQRQGSEHSHHSLHT